MYKKLKPKDLKGNTFIHEGRSLSGKTRKCTECGEIKNNYAFKIKDYFTNKCIDCRGESTMLPKPHYINGRKKLNKEEYNDYLKSKHWQDVKNRYWKSKRPKKCYICGGFAAILHHMTYKRLGCENLTDLVAVCDKCHSGIHKFHKMNPHLNLWKATKLYRKEFLKSGQEEDR